MLSFNEILQRIEKEIKNLRFEEPPRSLFRPIEYTLTLGGKRIRPAFTLIACNIYREDVEDAIYPALGLEVFHNFTLLHDDLMDEADKRRNKPTVHNKWNANTAILSGDAMLIVAYQLIGETVSHRLKEVLDIKQENFDLTSGWRASQGHEVFLFNPFAEDKRTHRWNPLSYVSDDPNFRVSELMSIAAMLYPDGSDDQKFWISQARNAFMAFGLYLFENWDDERAMGFPAGSGTPTLGAIFRLSTGDGTDLKKYLQSLSTQPFLSGNAKAAFANMLSQADETFASIMGTFKEPLNAWINPVLDKATSANDFLLTDLRKKKMTVYIGIQPNKLAESRLIINLFFSQIINLNTKELPKGNPELKYQVLLLMDEFTSIGKVDIIASAVSYMAGYNVRLLPIIQSMAQLDATYGRDVSRTIITNHALQILYAPREQQDANDYSEMLGYTTVRKKNVTHAREKTHNFTEERRALMLPQELKAMGMDHEVFLYEGIPHPVKCDKIKYYKDKYFTSRLLPKTDVKMLEL